MPPALSDHESEGSDDGQDFVPARAGQKPGDDVIMNEGDEDENEDEEEEGGEDEYTVEKIIKHDFDEDRNVIYQVKWLGYEKVADRTWEPKEHLETAQDILDAYHAKIGGEPVFEPEPEGPKKKGSRGKKRGASGEDVQTSSKKSRKSNGVENGESKKIELPLGSWESHVLKVSNLMNETNETKNGKTEEKLIGLLIWHDAKMPKTQHPLKTIRQKCPQKLLDYYEQHLIINQAQKAEEQEG